MEERRNYLFWNHYKFLADTWDDYIFVKQVSEGAEEKKLTLIHFLYHDYDVVENIARENVDFKQRRIDAVNEWATDDGYNDWLEDNECELVEDEARENGLMWYDIVDYDLYSDARNHISNLYYNNQLELIAEKTIESIEELNSFIENSLLSGIGGVDDYSEELYDIICDYFIEWEYIAIL